MKQPKVKLLNHNNIKSEYKVTEVHFDEAGDIRLLKVSTSPDSGGIVLYPYKYRAMDIKENQFHNVHGNMIFELI